MSSPSPSAQPPAIPPRSPLRLRLPSGLGTSSLLSARDGRSSSQADVCTRITSSLHCGLSSGGASPTFCSTSDLTPSPMLPERSTLAHISAIDLFSPRHFREPSETNNIARPSLYGNDLYRVRDGRPIRSASSGVYTPETFPGPLGQLHTPESAEVSGPYGLDRATQQIRDACRTALSRLRRLSEVDLKGIAPLSPEHTSRFASTPRRFTSPAQASEWNMPSPPLHDSLLEPPLLSSRLIDDSSSSNSPDTPLYTPCSLANAAMNPLWAGSYFSARNHTFLDPDALDLSKDLPPVPFTKLELSNYPETRAPIDSRSRSRRKPVPYDVDDDTYRP